MITFLILFLILFTAFIKNSTKKIEENIFVLEENLRKLNKEFENIKLEYEYLSSTEKLFEFQNLYFDDELVKKNIKDINIIDNSDNKFQIKKLQINKIMNVKNTRIVLENKASDFLYDKSKSKIDVKFNRIAFIFLYFLLFH